MPDPERRLRGLLARDLTAAQIDQLLDQLRAPEKRLRTAWRNVRAALIAGTPASAVLDLMDAADRDETDRIVAARRAAAPRCELESPNHPGSLCALVFGHHPRINHRDAEGRTWPWGTTYNGHTTKETDPS
jgi:hypothetical protein